MPARQRAVTSAAAPLRFRADGGGGAAAGADALPVARRTRLSHRRLLIACAALFGQRASARGDRGRGIGEAHMAAVDFDLPVAFLGQAAFARARDDAVVRRPERKRSEEGLALKQCVSTCIMRLSP